MPETDRRPRRADSEPSEHVEIHARKPSALDRDAVWFAAHPGVASRVRPTRPDEQAEGCSHVLVVRGPRGRLVRFPIEVRPSVQQREAAAA